VNKKWEIESDDNDYLPTPEPEMENVAEKKSP